ncbi:MAG: LLM class F420-dependent oxidoreductase [Chloroflexota bacterium]
MKVGLQIIDFTWPGAPTSIGEKLGAIGRRAEEVGADSLWVMDHFFQSPKLGAVEDPMPEAYTALAFVAGQTSRIGLGVMVTGVTYRHPGVLIKTVSTLDVLSGGRAWFGIGAGWYEREHVGLGVPFPPLKERFERVEETLQIARLMWLGEVTAFEGKHYRLAETLNSPQAISRPHPPILVGGAGEQKTLRLVAKYGDACNFFAALGEETLVRKLDVLRGYCEEEGRAYEGIAKTVIGDPAAMRDGEGNLVAGRVVEHGAHLAELGFDYFHLSVPNVSEPGALDLLGDEIVPAIHKL